MVLATYTHNLDYSNSPTEENKNETLIYFSRFRIIYTPESFRTNLIKNKIMFLMRLNLLSIVNLPIILMRLKNKD